MTRGATYLCAAALVATPALADLRPAPNYFIGALISSEIAQAIAVNCPELSVDPVAARKMSEDVLGWLQQDGFDIGKPTTEMEDPSDKLASMQKRFIDKHELAGAGADKVCAAGRMEMADETDIGMLLVEVPQ